MNRWRMVKCGFHVFGRLHRSGLQQKCSQFDATWVVEVGRFSLSPLISFIGVCYIKEQMELRREPSSTHPLASKSSTELKAAKMASTPSPDSNLYHVRSVSLPSRSHPLSVRVEEGLHKLKSWATSSLLHDSAPTVELLCVGLQALEEMYDCVEELLRLPRTQKALARHHCEKWAAEELDSSVRLLDICGVARDAISSTKEQAQGLQSALRTRRAGDSIVESRIRAFVHSRKKVHEDSSKCLKTLKQMEAGHPAYPLSAADHDLSLAVRALKDLREVTIVVYRSISSFMGKPRRGLSSSSRASEGEQGTSTELARVEASLRSIHGRRSEKDAGFEKNVGAAQRRLQGLEVGMGGLETGLESMFRRLVQNRVTLLNIFSPQ